MRQSREALWGFTYRSGHLEVTRRRREWFERRVEALLVVWRVLAGRLPAVDEAPQRLADLRTHGPVPVRVLLLRHRRRGRPAASGRAVDVTRAVQPPTQPEQSGHSARPTPGGRPRTRSTSAAQPLRRWPPVLLSSAAAAF
ncbi:DUF3291 domain-containing protein [Streptomyces sp. MMG1121]|uniref:DUF3291 domain-containing protein n=1 Tax=Streptomyces sp. MMG1121 TaxID=1415544 RepID=UPI001F2BA272|nr:DUF3291 domain-containing protein [Streptomyces sp. MMG1121]